MELLNPDTIESFQELMEPQELKDFLGRAHQELLRSHTLMQKYFADGEWPALRSVAHRLKGSLGSIGCDALYTQLEQIEVRLMQEPPEPPTEAGMVQLRELVEKTAGLLNAAS